MPVIQTRVSDQENAMLRNAAKMRGMTISRLIREAIEKDLATNLPKLTFGARKGDIWLAEDFCEPLEDIEDMIYG